jgi:hypothetical protein
MSLGLARGTSDAQMVDLRTVNSGRAQTSSERSIVWLTGLWLAITVVLGALRREEYVKRPQDPFGSLRSPELTVKRRHQRPGISTQEGSRLPRSQAASQLVRWGLDHRLWSAAARSSSGIARHTMRIPETLPIELGRLDC